MRLKSLMLASAGLVLAGCASLPSHPNSEVIESVMYRHGYVVALSDKCNLDPQLEQLADQAQTYWLDRNEPLLRTAEMSLVDMLRSQRDVVTQDNGALAAMAIYEHRDRQAEQRALAVQRSGNCQQALNEVLSGSEDVDDSAYQTLMILQASLPVSITRQQGAYVAPSEKVYGKAFYSVEQAAKTQQCASPEVNTLLVNQGREWYASECQDSVWLWSCQWGACEKIIVE